MSDDTAETVLNTITLIKTGKIPLLNALSALVDDYYDVRRRLANALYGQPSTPSPAMEFEQRMAGVISRFKETTKSLETRMATLESRADCSPVAIASVEQRLYAVETSLEKIVHVMSSLHDITNGS